MRLALTNACWKIFQSFAAYNTLKYPSARHRWEMNNKYVTDFENAGLMAVEQPW